MREKFFFLVSVLLFLTPASRSQGQTISPAAPDPALVLQKIYSFDLDGAIRDARQMQEARPEHPLGYLLEAEAAGWKIWCLTADFKYGFTEARRRPKLPSDKSYFTLASKISSLAEDRLHEHESPEMHFYAAMGDAAAARLYGLRGENRSVARAGVRAREHFLHALELDPDFADAGFGLGLYNYYVDTLSGLAKVMRFFMGIPGGSKKDGLRQLELAIRQGNLTRADASFYLALNLLKYDRDYERALKTILPLADRYPSNPFFQLLLGDCYAKLARNPQATAAYQSAAAIPIADPECAARVKDLAKDALASLRPSPESRRPD